MLKKFFKKVSKTNDSWVIHSNKEKPENQGWGTGSISREKSSFNSRPVCPALPGPPHLTSTQESENPHLVDKAHREPMATAYLAPSQPTCLKASGRGLSLSRQKYGIMSVRAADTPK